MLELDRKGSILEIVCQFGVEGFVCGNYHIGHL